MDEQDRAAIVALLAAQDAAWAAGDAAAFGARCLPDVVFTNIVGMFSVGKTPFDAQHAHIFASIYRGTRMTQELVHIATPTADIAVVDTLTAVTGAERLPPGVEAIDGALRTRLEQVMVRRDGGWWVQAFHNVPVNPAAGAVARPGV